MTEQAVDNSGADFGTGATDSAPVEANQNNETSGNFANSSAETKNTDKAEHMIPKSRFDEVNNKYKELSSKSEQYKIYEQLDSILSEDENLAQEIAEVLEKRKKPAQAKQTQNNNQSFDPVVGNLAKDVAFMKAERNVEQYHKDFESNFANSGLPESAKGLYKMHVEQAVLSQLNGELWRPYNRDAVQKALEQTKQLLDPYVQNVTKSYSEAKQGSNIPATRPNPPMQTTKLSTTKDRIAFIANGLKSGR